MNCAILFLGKKSRQTNRETDRKIYLMTNRETDRHIDLQTNKEIDKSTDKQTERQIDLQTDKQTNRQTGRLNKLLNFEPQTDRLEFAEIERIKQCCQNSFYLNKAKLLLNFLLFKSSTKYVYFIKNDKRPSS